VLLCFLSGLIEIFSVQVKRLAEKNISNITCLMSSGMLNINSVSQSVVFKLSNLMTLDVCFLIQV